ncbi:conserved hypothetical protein [groundwater metagenome]|uniref:DJ-1/PfpI domain-containing protein n=1 Tax=groundwater metagenome TaxID=717931 RepID=A0A098EEY2_9ZZZZ
MTNEAKDLNVLYLIGNGFRPEEYFYSKEEINNGGFKVITAGKDKIVPARSIPGMPTSAKTDKTFDEIEIENLDKNFIAVVVPGGSPGWLNLLKNDKVLHLIKHAGEKGMFVASICSSVAVLSKTGILKGKKATIWPGQDNDVITGGGIPINADESFIQKTVVVRDGKIITANGPWASREFGKAIVEELNKKFKVK